jgi:hypothetical protein
MLACGDGLQGNRPDNRHAVNQAKPRKRGLRFEVADMSKALCKYGARTLHTLGNTISHLQASLVAL